jgi:hypothetical protein
MAVTIKNCFSIGFRCNTDDFMKALKIRNYSSPFSYMICDLETSIEFISNDFTDFFDVVSKKEHNFKWNKWRMTNHLFFNKRFLPDTDNVELSEIKRICLWNHHDLHDITVVNTIKRRCLRLLNAEKLTDVLYIYIDNIHTYDTDNWENYFKKETVTNFISSNSNRYILLLLPLLGFKNNPVLYKINANLNVIFYESNMDVNINEYGNSKIRWDLIKDLMFENYKFDIDEYKGID